MSAEGFAPYRRANVIIDINATVKIEVPMKIGDSSQVVEVSAAPPLLQTQDATVGATITQTEIDRLPINGRNYTRLILLSPGVSDKGGSQSQGTFSGTALYSVNGQRQQDNNYMLDGVDNNFLFQNSPGMSPPQDAIQEFRVMNDSTAEFGRSAGANVNLTLRSGTNEFHGTVYDYLRNDVLDANDWFRNYNKLPRYASRWNQFGITSGGPVRLGRLFDGRNRTFWFANYEGFRQLQGVTTISNVPTVAARTGDLSAYGVNIYDPFSSSNTAARNQFANAIIPSDRISPAALYWLNAILPLPNNGSGVSSNYINTAPQTNNRNLWDVRLDHQLTHSQTLMFRYSFQDVDYVAPATTEYQSSAANFNVRNAVFGWTKVIDANSVLEIKFGFNNSRIPIHDVNTHVTRDALLANAGLQMFQASVPYGSLPTLSVSGNFSYATGTGGGGQITEDHIYQPIVDYTRTLKAHTLKAGGTVHIRDFFQTTANPMNGSLSFATTQTGNGTGGSSLASFLLGVPTSYTLATGGTDTEGYGPYQAYYIQDDWRATPALTLNLGLRYELTTPPYASNDSIGTLAIRYDPSVNGYTYQQYWAGNNSFTGQGPQRGPYGRSLQRTNHLNFAPRIGIVYQMSPTTVIRAGFGDFYNSAFFQELQDKRKFYPYVPQISNTVNTAGIPNFLITSPSPAATGNIGGYAQDPEKKSPLSQQWNLYVERQLPGRLTAELGYFGSNSIHQIGYTYINEASLGSAPLASRRPIPTLGDLYGGLNIFASNYNSFRANVVKRYSNGLQLIANYTFGKVLTEQSSLAEINTQNQFNRLADYGRASYDIRHIFQAAYVYDLPFGRGRSFGSHWNPAVDAVLGGWSLSGITRIETGSPMNVLVGSDVANVGLSAQRPNLVSNPNTPGARTRVKNGQPWFRATAFVRPAAGTFGNAGQNIVEGDGRNSWDASIDKRWTIWNEQSLEFRSEFFNFPNHINFINPLSGNLSLSSSAFGVVTSATPSRQVQLSLRYNY